MFNFNVLSVRRHIISGSSRICPIFNCNYTYRERSLAWLSTPKLCAVRCEPFTLLNGHFSDSDGGADGTVGKLSVTRVRFIFSLGSTVNGFQIDTNVLSPFLSRQPG
jgi:hypothetical protein